MSSNSPKTRKRKTSHNKSNSNSKSRNGNSRRNLGANSEYRPVSSRLRYPLFEKAGTIYSRLAKKSKNTRDMTVIYFGKSLDVTSEYDGKRRTLERTHLPFYQTTASSTTNTDFPWLKETWFPCFGLGLNGHIFKLSGLKSVQGAIAKWPQFLSQQKSLQNKLHERGRSEPLYTMDVLTFKNDKGEVIDEDTFFKAIGARCPSWDLLRISAGIGEGFWKDTPLFREFVTGYTFDKGKRSFLSDPYFIDSVRKTKTMNTRQVYEDRDDAHSIDLLRCRITDIPEFRIVITNGHETELVDF
jgi:hypothetical protein